MASPRRCTSPIPSVTKMVWPLGWVCHAVRAPGVKWTLLVWRRDWSDGAATASMYTVPVNHSVGPAMVSMEFGVICMSFLLRGRCGTVSNLEYGREGRQDSFRGADRHSRITLAAVGLANRIKFMLAGDVLDA